MAKVIVNRWFVSATMKEKGKLLWAARQTKGFATEIEAKQYARAMLYDGHNVTAGTLSPHHPMRRTVAASEVCKWVEEESP